jgi:hypothetical protein
VTELTTRVPPPRFPWLGYWLALAVIVVVASAPLISAFLATEIANANGCVLDGAAVHECRVEGVDRGDLLHSVAMSDRLFLVTMPLGGIAFLGWLAILIPHRLRWGSKRKMVRKT